MKNYTIVVNGITHMVAVEDRHVDSFEAQLDELFKTKGDPRRCGVCPCSTCHHLNTNQGYCNPCEFCTEYNPEDDYSCFKKIEEGTDA